MQQHYQVINLHNIIRGQQAKIQQLREELRIVNEREQIRYGQFVKNNRFSLDQKDRMIQFLKSELDKAHNNAVVGTSDVVERCERQKQKIQKQLITHKRKCIQLQARLKRSQNQSQIKIQSLSEQLKRSNEQLKRLQQAKTTLSLQITKLNHYYKTSLFEIGKRKETLLWVDKFTEYLESSEIKEKRTLDDVSSFVKAEINTLRNSLVEMGHQVAKNQNDIQASKTNLTNQISKFAGNLKQQCQKSLEQSEQFWTQIVKQEKDLQKSQQIKHLQSQLQKIKQSHNQEIEQLKSRLKSSESQKKTIILGFQELRSLTQQKQTNYKQQIKHLKKKIQELMDIGTQRDQEFQSELKILTNQIENISQRYYENIENPARKANIRFNEEIQEVKNMLAKIQENQWFKKSIEKIQKYTESYAENNTSKSKEFQQCISQSNQLLEEIYEAVNNGKDNSSNKTFTSRVHTFEKQLDQINEQEQVVLKQKLNKSQYQIVLAKKHLSKLKEYCENLQKKNLSKQKKEPKQSKQSKKGQKQRQKQRQKQNSAQAQKILQLQSQIQALQENMAYIKKQHSSQLDQYRRKLQLKSISQDAHQSSQQNIKNSLSRITQLIYKVQQSFKKQNQQINQIKENVKILKNVLYQPMHSLELITRDITRFKDHGNGVGENNQQNTERNTERNYHVVIQHTHRSQISVFSNGTDQIKAYKDILNKRTQIHQNTNKMITELIRVMRQTSTFSFKENKEKTVLKKQEQPQKRPQLKLRNIQKRLRDLQTQRLKDKQQQIQKLEKLEQNLQKLSNKISKSATLKSTLTKFESNLDTKINQIINRTQIKLDKTEILTLKDQIISDLKSKLQEANGESQGLRKEMAVLLSERKSSLI